MNFKLEHNLGVNIQHVCCTWLPDRVCCISHVDTSFKRVCITSSHGLRVGFQGWLVTLDLYQHPLPRSLQTSILSSSSSSSSRCHLRSTSRPGIILSHLRGTNSGSPLSKAPRCDHTQGRNCHPAAEVAQFRRSMHCSLIVLIDDMVWFTMKNVFSVAACSREPYGPIWQHRFFNACWYEPLSPMTLWSIDVVR